MKFSRESNLLSVNALLSPLLPTFACNIARRFVQVVNAATPGFNIGNFLHNNLRSTLPLDSDVDLIIVDYGVNDAISEQFEFDLSNVKFAHEILISHVQNDMIHMPALLYAEGYISPARLRSVPLQGGNMAEVHAAVTRKYDIPMVGERELGVEMSTG